MAGRDIAGVRIDEQELVDLALALCNIKSLPSSEAAVGQYVYDWLGANGMEPRKLGLLPDRFCVSGRVRGRGDGYSLIFNSHFDTDTDLVLYDHAGRSGEMLYGEGIVNDKGPMAAFLIAAKAIKASGIELLGDLLVSGVPGEIGVEPVDEFTAPEYLSKELGARFLIQHGAVADFALNAEGTDFRYAAIEAGKAFFKVIVYGEAETYTPFVPAAAPSSEHPNAIVRAAVLVPALQRWANDYERRFTYTSPGGTIVPKVVIGAVRGGKPYHITRSAAECSLYLDVRLIPGQDPVAVRRELQGVLARDGIAGDVELFLYRQAHEAGDTGPLLRSLDVAHRQVLGTTLELAEAPISSMWRDLTVFNEAGIPCITYGPTRGDQNRTITVADLCRVADVYAVLALNLCRTEKPVGGVAERHAPLD